VMVRCGACRNQFDVPGPGRYSCPVCGSVNMVRSATPTDPRGQGGPGPGVAPPPRPPDPPSNRITCPECDFRFIVGDIDLARCPNCGAEVKTGTGEPPGADQSPAGTRGPEPGPEQ
jgi:DNA-directed RNA polymerase subunit RPC12/RpoP